MSQQANSQHYFLLQYFIEQIPLVGGRHVFGLVELNGARHLIKSVAISWVDEPLAMAYSQHASFQLGQLITDDAEKFMYRRILLKQNGKNIFDTEVSTKLCLIVH